MIRLHLEHLRNALIALPFFFAWLEFSRARSTPRPRPEDGAVTQGQGGRPGRAPGVAALVRGSG